MEILWSLDFCWQNIQSILLALTNAQMKKRMDRCIIIEALQLNRHIGLLWSKLGIFWPLKLPINLTTHLLDSGSLQILICFFWRGTKHSKGLYNYRLSNSTPTKYRSQSSWMATWQKEFVKKQGQSLPASQFFDQQLLWFVVLQPSFVKIFLAP